MKSSPPLVVTPQPYLIEQNPELLSQARQFSIQWQHRQLVSAPAQKSFGLQLWLALDCQTTFDEALAAKQGERLYIAIEIDSPLIDQLPWELLYHPTHGFLAKHKDCCLFRTFSSSAN